MSLLLDALKKAADDKKKSVDDSADESHAQITKRAHDEDSLELELDEKQIIAKNPADDNDFSRVEDQSIPADKQQLSATETVSENTAEHTLDISDDSDAHDIDKHTANDTAHLEQPAELELTDIATTNTERTDTTIQTEEKTTASEPITAVNSAIRRADRASYNTDNEAALSALINKSNQYQQRAQKKRMILLVSLVLLLICGSAGFFYLKADIASQRLYITQSNSSPLQHQPATANNNSQVTADNQASSVTDDNNGKTADTTQSDNTASINHATDKPVINRRAAQTVQPATRAEANKLARSTIRIQQSRREDPVESLIADAYNAFQHGDYKQAQTRYQQVLAHEAKNRDATLGLAAIALKQQHYEYARQKYQSLLQLNPKDTLAIAGLSSLSLQHLSDSGLSESQLKFMLKEQPDSAHLYFALGSLYAEKNLWPQAQSAYFSAWSADNNNADYAFNLAVSLDHINQPQQALQYYQLSLKLMQRSAANFSAAQVQRRINSLQETMQ